MNVELDALSRKKLTRSILIISMGDALGDAIYKIPFLDSLTAAFPSARLTWYVGSAGTAFSDILKFYSDSRLHEIIVDPDDSLRKPISLLRPHLLTGRSFDIVIDTQMRILPSLNARVATRGTFVSRTLGGIFSQTRPQSFGSKKPVGEHLSELGRMAAQRQLPNLSPRFQDERGTAAAAQLLPDGKRYVGIAPGAGGVSKRWPLERFIYVARQLVEIGATPAFLVGPAELEFTEQIVAALPQAVFPELGRSDAYLDVHGPRLLLSLAQRLEFTLSNDAGVGHVCGLGGSPMITVFPSRRMERKFPPPGHQIATFSGDDFGSPSVLSIPQDVVAEMCLTAFRQHTVVITN